jgi:hypothetical protein
MVTGLMLTLLGVTTFYLVPEAFINQNLDLFFTIFNLLLMMIIFGMTFLAIIFFPYVEKLIKWVGILTCCRCDRKMESMI